MTSDKPINPLRIVREKICNWVLAAFSIFAVPTLVSLLFRVQMIGEYWLLGVQIAAAIVLWLFTIFQKNIPYHFRAGLIVFILMFVGLLGLQNYGLLAGSIPMLIVVSPLAVILFGARAGVLIALSVILVTTGIAYAVVYGALDLIIDPSVYAKKNMSWIGFIIGYILAVGTLLVAVIITKKQLILALEEALQGEKNLERQVIDRTKELENKEELLRHSEASLNEAQRVAKVGSWYLDTQTKEVVWSKELYKIYGLDPNYPPPSSSEHSKLFTPASWDRLNMSLANSAEKGVSYELELETVKSDGGSGWILARGEVVIDATGKTIGLQGIAQELTERKQAEAKLKESEERYALAMQGANDGLWDWDIFNDKVHFSPRWKSMLGYAENEIKNNVLEWERLVHPDDLASASSMLKDYLDNKAKKYETEFRMQHKDGQYINILSRAFAVEDYAGKITRMVGTHVDITEHKKVEEQLSYQASHDALTGLINRREFERRTERLLLTPKGKGQNHALCYMDLDQFKVVNDTCGHAAGDEMLRQISTMLQRVVRHRDTLARLGGDEFGILMEHCSLDDAHRVTNSIQTAIQDYQFIFEGRSFRVGASMGLVPITDTTLNLRELLKDADAACYMAKDKGRNRIHVHRGGDTDLAQRHGEMQWVTRIQHALDENRFCLYAQAIESLDNATEVHFELLIRMLDEQGEVIPPGAFLPAAERYDIIAQLDKWVVENAFRLLKQNPAFLEKINFISINLSGQSLTNEAFHSFVIKQLQELDAYSAKICFEITETAAISNLSMANKFIAELRAFGCRFALDDFGSGLSSFAYLKNLPVDYLKIDGMFVKDMVDDPIDHAMVKSIHEIGKLMGMQTIAEFVENEMIKTMLKEIGVDYAQGYGVSKPQPFEALLSQR
jgi:diguanylate cyclase (GGDEF)-like protein/PAS domain S-box-containing protein